MHNIIFENPVKVFFGEGCVREYLRCLTKSCDRVLLACGCGLAEEGAIYREVSQILTAAGKRIVPLSGIRQPLTYDKVLEGAGLVRENGAEMILGVGDGSVMNCCKAVSLAACYEGDVWNDFWERPGIVDFDPIPVGLIATSAMGGSECNGCIVLTNEERKRTVRREYPIWLAYHNLIQCTQA